MLSEHFERLLVPRLTDKILQKRLAEHRSKVEQNARPTMFTIAWRAFEFSAIAAGVAALWFSVVSIQHAAEQTELAKIALNEQQIANAWTLFENSENDQVKIYSVNTLIGKGFDLYGIDFSCAHHFYHGYNTNGRCARPLSGITFQRNAGTVPDSTSVHSEVPTVVDSSFKNRMVNKLSAKGLMLGGADFSYSQVNEARFINTVLRVVSFDGATLNGTVFEHETNFSLPFTADTDFDVASFKNASLKGVTFRNVRLGLVDFTDANLAGTSFQNAQTVEDEYFRINISAADLCDRELEQCVTGLTQELVNSMWFYADQPPHGIEAPQFSHLNFNEPCQLKDNNDPLHFTNDFSQTVSELWGRASAVRPEQCYGN